MKRKLSILLVAIMVLMVSVPVCAAEPMTGEGTTTSVVTATKSDSWTVSVPDITLDSATGIGTGDVTVAADLGAGKTLSVTPDAIVTLTQAGKDDVVADVTMVTSSWSASEITLTPTTSAVTVTAQTELKAGTYTGALVYVVDLTE